MRTIKDKQKSKQKQHQRQALNSNKNHVTEIKEEESAPQKALSTLKKLFLGEPNIQPQINLSLVSNTYFTVKSPQQMLQFLEIGHTILLFAVFNKSNSATFSIIQSSIGGYLLLVYLIPRLSKKHSIFQISFILYLVGTLAAGLAFIVLFNSFSVFTFYCSEIKLYYEKKKITEYVSKSICEQVYNMYISEIIVETLILGLRLLYLFWCFRAYLTARRKFEEQEKKKRRKDRYNQLLLKRNMYNQKRRV